MRDSNEELVKRIQADQTEHIPQLWEQVQDFIKYLANKHLLNYPPQCQQFHGDMVDQAYFHFLKAIEGYRESKGKFTGYLAYHVKNAFNEVLRGRTQKAQNEPLNSAVSLDAPIEGTEDLTLADMLIDAESEAYYRHIEDEDLWKSVYEILRRGIGKLPEEYRDFFYVMLEHGTDVAGTLRVMGISPDKKAWYTAQYRKGLRRLHQHVKVYLARQKGKDIALEECISYYTGLGSWRNRRFTSVEEQAAIRRNDGRMAARAMEGVLALRP